MNVRFALGIDENMFLEAESEHGSFPGLHDPSSKRKVPLTVVF